MYPAGTVLKLNFGTYFHYGVADGKGGVIHNSKKHLEVTQECYESFAEGREIIVSDITSENPEEAVINAEQYIGMPYNLIRSNCEHFARQAHGLNVQSTQVQQYILGALGAGAAIKGKNPLVKVAGGAVALTTFFTSIEKRPFKNAAIAGLIAAGGLALTNVQFRADK